MNDKLRPVALLTVVALASVASVSATHVEPTKEDGNPTCSDFEPVDGALTEFKIEPVQEGEYTNGDLEVTLDVRSTSSGNVADFEANVPISAVVVKGGPNGNLYEYTPPVLSDSGLHSPVNDNNGKFFGLSHISFCYLDVEIPPDETCEENPDQEKCEVPEQTCEENPDQEKCEVPEQTCEENPDQDKCETPEVPCEEDPLQEKCEPEEAVCPIDTLVAIANEDGSITVSGSASGEFDLYRQVGGGETELIGEFSGDFVYTDTGTVAGTTYTYYAVSGPAECAQVEVTAIPVFPTAVAAIAAVGLSGLGYAVLRRRQ